jgi:hypothetical protein
MMIIFVPIIVLIIVHLFLEFYGYNQSVQPVQPVQLTFFKRIDTAQNSIFYSLLSDGTADGTILGFARKQYDERETMTMTFDKNFEIETTADVFIKGEDPRVFRHNGCIYVVDNYLHDVHLYNYTEETYTRINIDGKNLSFISHGDELYFIHTMRPFKLCKVDTRDGSVQAVDCGANDNDTDNRFRGGTPGYNFNTPNIYYGFGHKTYIDMNNVLIHDIFMWVLRFDTHPSLEIINIDQPAGSKNITDPTCVVHVNDALYLLTAESDEPWFIEQNYVTNVYELQFITQQ